MIKQQQQHQQYQQHQQPLIAQVASIEKVDPGSMPYQKMYISFSGCIESGQFETEDTLMCQYEVAHGNNFQPIDSDFLIIKQIIDEIYSKLNKYVKYSKFLMENHSFLFLIVCIQEILFLIYHLKLLFLLIVLLDGHKLQYKCLEKISLDFLKLEDMVVFIFPQHLDVILK